MGFHGEFREISRPKRIVSTEVYEQFPDPDGTSGALDIVTLDEADGVTTMKVLVQHARPEHRDAHIASGMESGMQISYNRLEDLIRQSRSSRANRSSRAKRRDLGRGGLVSPRSRSSSLRSSG